MAIPTVASQCFHDTLDGLVKWFRSCSVAGVRALQKSGVPFWI
ncbi:hypothetical protein [uncultured Nitrosomonas sp.]|nr:hypothetical protein [uncultured Nitrosomonas sp.]